MDALHMVLMPASARATASKAGYCKVCAKMLGTAEGVRRLCVMPGYRHLNKHECKKSADRGCPLCGIILRGGWEAERFRPIVLPSQPGTSGLRRESELKKEEESQPLYFLSRRANSRWKPPNLDSNADNSWEDKISKGYGDMEWLDGAILSHKTNPPRTTRSHHISLMIMASQGEFVLLLAGADDQATSHN